MYNLGTVQEKTGDKDGALKSYIASLKLRPNKTVEQAVGRLGASPTADSPCTPACDCIAMDAYATNNPKDYEVSCANDAFPTVKGFHVYHLKGWQDYDYLLDEHDQIVTAFVSVSVSSSASSAG